MLLALQKKKGVPRFSFLFLPFLLPFLSLVCRSSFQLLYHLLLHLHADSPLSPRLMSQLHLAFCLQGIFHLLT